MERAPLTESQFRQLWAKPGKLDSLCGQAGISRSVAYAMAEKYGLPARPKGGTAPKKIDVPLLFKLWNEQVELREIALALGVSESFVSRLGQRHKLPKRAKQKQQDNGMRVDDPTPEQIAERAAWCRSRRSETDHAKPVDIRAYHYDDRTGLYTGIESWAV